MKSLSVIFLVVAVVVLVVAIAQTGADAKSVKPSRHRTRSSVDHGDSIEMSTDGKMSKKGRNAGDGGSDASGTVGGKKKRREDDGTDRSADSAPAKTHKSSKSAEETYIDWLNSNQVDTSKVKLADITGRGPGLRAAVHIEKGETILTIPVAVFISSEHALKDDAIGSILGNISGLTAQEQLALFLLHEIGKPSSPFKPWFDTMPMTPTSSMFFSDEDLEIVNGSVLYSQTITRKSYLQQFHKRHVVSLSKSHSDLFPASQFTLENFMWAINFVNDKALVIETEKKAIPVLIPVQDRIFHDVQYLASVDLDSKEQLIRIVASQTLAAGDPINVSRGQKTDALMLLNQGYILDDNIHNIVVLKFPEVKDPSSLPSVIRTQLAKKLDLELNATFACDGVDLHTRVFTLARIVSLLPDEMSADLLEFGLEDDEYISLDNELRAYKLLLRLINETDSKYGVATLEGDELALNASKTVTHWLAYAVRVRERRILRNTRSVIEKRWSNLLLANSDDDDDSGGDADASSKSTKSSRKMDQSKAAAEPADDDAEDLGIFEDEDDEDADYESDDDMQFS